MVRTRKLHNFTRPEEVVDEVFGRIDAIGDPAIFIHLCDREEVRAAAKALGPRDQSKPLWGIPFAIMRDDPEAIHPVTRKIIGAAEGLSAADAFKGLYRLKELGRFTSPLMPSTSRMATMSN